MSRVSQAACQGLFGVGPNDDNLHASKLGVFQMARSVFIVALSVQITIENNGAT